MWQKKIAVYFKAISIKINRKFFGTWDFKFSSRTASAPQIRVRHVTGIPSLWSLLTNSMQHISYGKLIGLRLVNKCSPLYHPKWHYRGYSPAVCSVTQCIFLKETSMFILEVGVVQGVFPAPSAVLDPWTFVARIDPSYLFPLHFPSWPELSSYVRVLEVTTLNLAAY